MNGLKARFRSVQIGRNVEHKAKAYLETIPQSRILDQNFRTKGGEIDFIVEEWGKGKTELVFVEVRYRPKDSRVSALESVGSKKRRRLERAAGYFLMHYCGPAQTLRFDILSWSADGQWARYEMAWN